MADLKLNLIPSGVMPVLYVNQYDFGMPKTFEIYKGAEPYQTGADYSVTLRATKPDGYGITVSGSFTVGENLVTVVIPQQLTAVAGKAICELVFANTSAVRLGTINFVLAIEAAALSDSTVISDSDIAYAEEVLDQLQSVQALGNQVANNTAAISAEASTRAAEVSSLQGADTALSNSLAAETSARQAGDTALSDQIAALQGAVGSPLVAATKSAMTETDRIYVYTGSESGMTSGNWYYYDGSAWVSGGVYNAVAVNADTTLSVAGMAADAKATGDQVTDLKSQLQWEATYRQALGHQITENDLVTLICPCVLEIANTTIETSTGKRISMTGLTTRYYETGYASDDVVLSYYSKYAFYAALPDTQTASIDGVAHVGPGTNVKATLINGTKFIGIATPSNFDVPIVKTTNIGITELLGNTLFNNIEHEQLIASANVQSGCTVNADGSISVPVGAYYFRAFDVSRLIGDGRFNIKMSPVMDINIYKNSSTSGGGIDGYAVASPKEDGSIQATLPHGEIEENYPYAVVRVDNRLGENDITIYSIDLFDTYVTIPNTSKLTRWVSPNGNDGNEGTENSPFATVDTALQRGASVVMLSQGVYTQQIDLSYAKNPNIELRCGEPYHKVVFKDPDSVLATSETKVSDTTKVYSATVTVSINANNNWIYQEGIADAATLISDAERHPLERGYTYRCEDTKISRCTADNVADALSEIDSSDDYKWFLDDDNNTIYYSRPQTVSAEHPICYSTGKTLFSNGSKNGSLKAVGIETKYMAFNINDLSSAELLECKSSNVFGDGAFVYDRCQSSKFVRCEAVRCQNGVSGDGFNGHSTSSGDTFSKQTDTTLIDCWSHDNNDDGYSDHERCEVALFGGLYEYNHKGGVMPSYGSHCMCYDVLSRNNYNGFYCAGEATVAEGGKGTQMWCYNCIAENNEVPGANYGSGFVVSNSGNSAVLINCKAIGNEIGYSCFNTAIMKIIDCGGRLNTALKAGTIEITNTTTVV